LTFRVIEIPGEGYSYQSGEWPDGLVEKVQQVWPSVLGIGVYGLLAWAFFAAAARRFERDGRG
jgi:hypothetical protein